MKWFISTKFLEEDKAIELISIALISEFDEEFYALNKNCDLKAAWKDFYTRENILKQIYNEYLKTDFIQNIFPFNYKTMKKIFKIRGLDYSTIRIKILNLFSMQNPEFWGYCCSYDWFLFCKIFGKRFDLPKKFPIYCKDLKQYIDERKISTKIKNVKYYSAIEKVKWIKNIYKDLILKNI